MCCSAKKIYRHTNSIDQSIMMQIIDNQSIVNR